MEKRKLYPLNCPKDLDKSWLSQMLGQYFGTKCEVKKYEVVSPAGKEGYLSEIRLVRVYYSDGNIDKNERFVFKYLPNDRERKSFILNGKLPEREVKFYEFSLSEEFKVVVRKSEFSHLVPRVFYCDIVEEDLTLVMEDMNLLRYKTVMEKNGFGLRKTLICFEAIAVVHVAGLLFFKEKGRFPMLKYTNTSYLDGLISSNMTSILCDLYQGDNLYNIFCSLIPLSNEIASAHLKTDFFDTVIHGDFWAGQCMFSSQEDKVCILDWQFASVGNPIADLMGMFFMTCDPVIIESKLEVILKHYWSKLTQLLEDNNVPIPSTYERFVDCVEELWMCGFSFIAASLSDFFDNDVITEQRVRGLVSFLHKRNVFTKFIEKFATSVKSP